MTEQLLVIGLLAALFGWFWPDIAEAGRTDDWVEETLAEIRDLPEVSHV